MRLIDADEIRIKPDFIFYGVCGTPVIRCEDLARIINDMPTIHPKPERKKGKWIHDNPNTFKCSECNKYLDISCGNMKMNFCPNCETDMRGIKE